MKIIQLRDIHLKDNLVVYTENFLISDYLEGSTVL